MTRREIEAARAMRAFESEWNAAQAEAQSLRCFAWERCGWTAFLAARVSPELRAKGERLDEECRSARRHARSLRRAQKRAERIAGQAQNERLAERARGFALWCESELSHPYPQEWLR